MVSKNDWGAITFIRHDVEHPDLEDSIVLARPTGENLLNMLSILEKHRKNQASTYPQLNLHIKHELIKPKAKPDQDQSQYSIY